MDQLSWILTVVVGVAVAALTVYNAHTRRGAGQFLCQDCRFNDPELCKKSVRPRADRCTSYRPFERDTDTP